MATTTPYAPVTVEKIDRADWDSDPVEEGQHVLYGAYGFTAAQFEPQQRETDASGIEHPAIVAWDAMLDEVMREVHPKIADLFYEAINRRLPWTWEPER